jgi:hypothetical protein
MSEEIFEQIFPVAEPASLYLSNIRGKVQVATGSEEEIRVVAVKKLHTGDEKNTEIIIEQERDGRVYVETRMPVFSSWLTGSKPCQVDYEIRVPPHCKMTLSNVSSSCFVEGTEGDVQVKSVSGELTLTNVTGSLQIKSVSGNIEGVRLQGQVDFNTVSGAARISSSSLDQIAGKTVSGDIHLETPLVEGPYEVNTISGNLYLNLPSGQGITVSLSSVSGVVRTGSTTTNSGINGGSRNYELGGGGPLFRFRSVSGNFVVNHDGSDLPIQQSSRTTERPDRKSRSEPSDKTMEVLQQIEDGTISVEEGLERLNSLD